MKPVSYYEIVVSQGECLFRHRKGRDGFGSGSLQCFSWKGVNISWVLGDYRWKSGIAAV